MEIVKTSQTTFSKPLVATIGFFDGVHLGHQHLLTTLKEEAEREDALSAVITFPEHPRKVLRKDYIPQLLMDLDTRLSLLGQYGIEVCILLDFTPALSQLSAKNFLQFLKVSYQVQTLLMGYDHHFGSDMRKDFGYYRTIGEMVEVKVIQDTPFLWKGKQVSSSCIRRSISSGDVKNAAEMLSRPYSISGEVIHGNGIGNKSLGFPTANIVCSKETILPMNGVYAVRVLVGKDTMGGMLNIGTRPTLYESGEKTIETHIFDFNQGIYGEIITIEFVSFIRKEEKLGDVPSLIRKLKEDREQAQAILSSSF